MSYLLTRLRVVLAVLLLLGTLSLVPQRAAAYHPKKAVVTHYYNPVPVVGYHGHHYYGPKVHRYSASTGVFYSVPRAPVVPATVYTTPSYSFYQPGRVGVYVPGAPYASTTTYYRKGLLFPRVHSSTTTYYTPGFYRY